MRRTNVFARMLLTTLCSLALAWICMNVAPVTAEAATATSVNIIGTEYANGAEIADFDNSGAFSSFTGTATFEDGTLTLENVTIKCDPDALNPDPYYNVYGIQVNGDLKIELIGTNRIEGRALTALMVEGGSLTISGSGSLEVVQNYMFYGIKADSITICDGATVACQTYYQAAYVSGGAVLIDNATLTAYSQRNSGISAGEVTATGDVVVKAGGNAGEATEIEDAVDSATGVVNSDAWHRAYVYIQSTVKSAPAADDNTETWQPGRPCHHNYVWETYKAATATTDGIMRYRCKYCGTVEYEVPTAAYYVFNKETQESIRNAAQGATVTVSTPIFISFHEMVKDALVARPDVTLVVDYKNAGKSYEMTIPAGSGDTLTTLFGEDSYAGFLYLGGAFATVEK